jgi:hypothetical protein
VATQFFSFNFKHFFYKKKKLGVAQGHMRPSHPQGQFWGWPNLPQGPWGWFGHSHVTQKGWLSNSHIFIIFLKA